MQKSIKCCDNPGCGKTEEKGNHWYKVCSVSGLIILSRLEAPPIWEGFGASRWKDVCGRKCGAEMVAAWMGEVDPT